MDIQKTDIPKTENQKIILIVEDEVLLANLLKQRLISEGFNVLVARDGEEGLEVLRKTKPDLIMLDIILPKVSGFEFMEAVRADPQLEKAPIVVISNLGQESDIKRGESLGAVGYFVKAQVSIEDLVNKVKGFLSQA